MFHFGDSSWPMLKFHNLTKKTNQRDKKRREIAITSKGAKRGKNILLCYHCPPRESTLSQNVNIGNKTLLLKLQIKRAFL